MRDYELVLGKFLGVLLLLLILMAITLVYPAIMMLAGNPDRGPIGAAYLGVILQGAAFLAIGLFASSLTQNQIIAALLAFVILLIMWLADGLSQMTGGSSPATSSASSASPNTLTTSRAASSTRGTSSTS